MSIFDFFRGSEPPKEPQKKPNSDGFLFSTHVAPSVDYHPEFSIQKQIALDDGNIGTNDLPNKLTFFENAPERRSSPASDRRQHGKEAP